MAKRSISDVKSETATRRSRNRETSLCVGSDKTPRDGLPKIHVPGTCVGGRTELFLQKKTAAKGVKHVPEWKLLCSKKKVQTVVLSETL